MKSNRNKGTGYLFKKVACPLITFPLEASKEQAAHWPPFESGMLSPEFRLEPAAQHSPCRAASNARRVLARRSSLNGFDSSGSSRYVMISLTLFSTGVSPQ